MTQRPAGARGHLIVLEGIDGSGKSTLVTAIVALLGALGVTAVATAEPTRGAAGAAVRAALKDPAHDVFGEALLFAADHADHCSIIAELLREGTWVVSDRYSDSFLAYQCVTLREALGEPNARAWLRQVIAPFERRPDLVLLLDLPVGRAVQRLSVRGGSTDKFERRAFLEAVANEYRSQATELGYETIDADAPVDDVLGWCMDAIRKRFPEANA